MGFASGFAAGQAAVGESMGRRDERVNTILERYRRAAELNSERSKEESAAAEQAKLYANKYLGKYDPEGKLDPNKVAYEFYDKLKKGATANQLDDAIEEGTIRLGPQVDPRVKAEQEGQPTSELDTQTQESLAMTSEKPPMPQEQPPVETGGGLPIISDVLNGLKKLLGGDRTERTQRKYQQDLKLAAEQLGISTEELQNTLKMQVDPAMQTPEDSRYQIMPGQGSGSRLSPTDQRRYQEMRENLPGPSQEAVEEYDTKMNSLSQVADYMGVAYATAKEEPSVFSAPVGATASAWNSVEKLIQYGPKVFLTQEEDLRYEQMKLGAEEAKQRFFNTEGIDKAEAARDLYNSMLELGVYELGRVKGQEGRALSNEERQLLKQALETRSLENLLEAQNRILGTELSGLEKVAGKLDKANEAIRSYNAVIMNEVGDEAQRKMLMAQEKMYDPWAEINETDNDTTKEFLRAAGLDKKGNKPQKENSEGPYGPTVDLSAEQAAALGLEAKPTTLTWNPQTGEYE